MSEILFGVGCLVGVALIVGLLVWQPFIFVLVLTLAMLKFCIIPAWGDK